jgi:hypothetical protein
MTESAAFCFINFCHCYKKRGENLCPSKLEINPPRENFRATRKNSGPESAGTPAGKLSLFSKIRRFLMLLPTEREYLIRKEQNERFIRGLELTRALNELTQLPRSTPEIYRALINQLGAQMVRLGQKMETYGATSSRKLA